MKIAFLMIFMKSLAEELDEITYDYSIENKGKTHMLIVEFPEPCDEECFLIALKAYFKAQNENLQRCYAGIGYN